MGGKGNTLNTHLCQRLLLVNNTDKLEQLGLGLVRRNMTHVNRFRASVPLETEQEGSEPQPKRIYSYPVVSCTCFMHA